MKQRLTQKQMVQRHLETFGNITTYDAIIRYKVTRLSAIIWFLREDGMNINSIFESDFDGISYVRYYYNRN